MCRSRLSPIMTLILAVLAALVSSGCFEERRSSPPLHQSNCTTCHGSPLRPGSELDRAAPPFDLSGRTNVSARGVGAHLAHQTSATHAPVACEQCHIVPKTTDAPGHADSALPAEVTFGQLAQHDGSQPSYDSEAGSCSNSYCHGAATIAWIPEPAAHSLCGSCHGLPPAAPHPAAEACERCHGEVVDASRNFVAPGKHVDGIVQVDVQCDSCHGSGELGLPPPALNGETAVTTIGVGAHLSHALGGQNSRGVLCADCHVVPAAVADSGHLDTSPRAEVTLAGVAASNGRQPVYDANLLRCASSWCHGPSEPAWPSSPRWNDGDASLGCVSCHGMPPAAPHPQISRCELCHGEVIDAALTIANRSLHVDGTVQLELPSNCDACHGNGPDGAPPADLNGSVATTSPGVGAHAIHLLGTGQSRRVPCQECHQVPDEVLATGHLDTVGPAELTFSGVATTVGTPEYAGGSCQSSYCHGGVTIFGFPSGGAATAPVWTLVDGSQRQCNSCHGLPPQTPGHPPATLLFCSDCHGNISGLLDIIDPELHVNGIVEL